MVRFIQDSIIREERARYLPTSMSESACQWMASNLRRSAFHGHGFWSTCRTRLQGSYSRPGPMYEFHHPASAPRLDLGRCFIIEVPQQSEISAWVARGCSATAWCGTEDSEGESVIVGPIVVYNGGMLSPYFSYFWLNSMVLYSIWSWKHMKVRQVDHLW